MKIIPRQPFPGRRGIFLENTSSYYQAAFFSLLWNLQSI